MTDLDAQKPKVSGTTQIYRDLDGDLKQDHWDVSEVEYITRWLE
jgi:hypothetical protein